MCGPFGRDKDGWNWVLCEQVQSEKPHSTLGFFGYPISFYREYFIATLDTTYAEILTDEIDRLGFTLNEQDHERWLYRSNLYPSLWVERWEKRMTNIFPNGKREENLLYQFKVHVPKNPDYSHGMAPPR